MSVFLLLLGAATTLAGLALMASGATAHDGAFDTEVITPGTIAAVGGLLLVGLGVAVRALRRIEEALLARPMPRSIRPGELPAAAATEPPGAVVPIPFPARPKPDLSGQPEASGANSAPAPAEDVTERLRAKFPSLARLEAGPVVEAAELSVAPQMPARVEENVTDVGKRVAAGRTNGGAPAGTAPRLQAGARPSPSPERARGAFNAFWPKGPRPVAQATAAPAALPLPPIESASGGDAVPDLRPAAGEPASPQPVTILKSGVVEGMAYSLYSDGSIEAQLPQGTLRFGSITELRNHIDSTA